MVRRAFLALLAAVPFAGLLRGSSPTSEQATPFLGGCRGCSRRIGRWEGGQWLCDPWNGQYAYGVTFQPERGQHGGTVLLDGWCSECLGPDILRVMAKEGASYTTVAPLEGWTRAFPSSFYS